MNEELQRQVEAGEISVTRYRLEEQVARISALRGSGRTHRACEHVKQLIAQHGDGCTVVWYIPEYTWLRHIMPMLEEVMDDFARVTNSIGAGYSNRVRIDGAWGSARLFFVSQESRHNLQGAHNVHFAYDEGEAFDYEYLKWPQQRVATEPDSQEYGRR